MAKKKKTYSEKAKEIMSKYKTRLGEDFDRPDKYALEAMKIELNKLKAKQEEARESLDLNDNTTMKKGGKLKEYKKGGKMKEYQGGGNIKNPYLPELQTGGYTNLDPISPTPIVNNPSVDIDSQLNDYLSSNAPANTSGANMQPFESSITPTLIGAGTSILGTALNMSRDDGDPVEVQPSSYKPEGIDLSAQRSQLKANAQNAKRGAIRRIRNAGSGVDFINNALNASTVIDNNLANQIIQSLTNEQTTNAQTTNQANRFNAQQESIANRINTRNKNIDRVTDNQRISEGVSGIANTVQGAVRDINSAGNYDKMIQILSENYTMAQDKQGNIFFKPKANFVNQ